MASVYLSKLRATAAHAVLRYAPPASILVVLAGVVMFAPSWWAEAGAAVGRVLWRHWLPTSVVVIGVVSWAAAIMYRRRVDGTRRRNARRPLATRFPLFAHVTVLLSLAVGLAAGFGAALWWSLGRPQLGGVATPAAWTAQETFDAMRIILFVVGGIGGVVALTVSYRKQDLGEAADHREGTRLFTERFSRTADQLGSDQAAVRLAGVYAMARLADDWAEERQTCIDVLCAYLRMPNDPPPKEGMTPESPEGADRGTETDDARATRQEREVRHTIIRIIAAHLRPESEASWRGHTFDFTGAVFDGGDFSDIEVAVGTAMSFAGGRFTTGHVRMVDAKFSGGDIDFRGAQFAGAHVDFRGTHFSGRYISFSNTKFSGGKVNFSGAEFSAAKVDFRGAHFSGGDVYFDAQFCGGDVDFTNGRFAGAHVDFSGARFSTKKVSFFGAELSGGDISFSGAEFSGGVIYFVGVRFSSGRVDFGDAKFCGGEVNFYGAKFLGATVDLSAVAGRSTPPPGLLRNGRAPKGVKLPTPKGTTEGEEN